MLFRSKKTRLTARESLSLKPVRHPEGELTPAPNGGAKLKVVLRPSRVSGWLLRLPSGVTKTFEFDAIGLLVWNNCDGKTSVQQIIRRLAKEYNLNLREAQVPTLAFLRTLVKKGLVAMVK
jgi:hypothetical protein